MRRAWLLLPVLLAGCGGQAGDAPFSGYAEADLVLLAAPSAGRLLTLPVQRGDQVAKGQMLYALETDAEALARESAAARAERAGATVADLRKGRRPNELQVIEQQLQQAQAALRGSASQLSRNQALVGQGFIAAVRLDELNGSCASTRATSCMNGSARNTRT